MITVESAIKLAKDFCHSQGEVVKDVYFDAEMPHIFADCFYFDFKIVDKVGKPSNEMIGGAPGFTIDKMTGEARIVGWQQYQDLTKQSRDLNDL